MREVNIKSAYYCFEDMLNIEDFHSNLLRIDKTLHRDIGIYYIGYSTIKKIGYDENIHSVNQFCLIINSATGYFKRKKLWKILNYWFDREIGRSFFLELNQKLKQLMAEKKCFMKKTILDWSYRRWFAFKLTIEILNANNNH